MDEQIASAFGALQSKAVARLDRKRATDRRAQRAARQRRQQQIDSLLHQIETLSGLPHDQVSEFFEMNDRLRAENEQLRSRTAVVLDDMSENDGDGSPATGIASSSSGHLLLNGHDSSPHHLSAVDEQYHCNALTVVHQPKSPRELYQCLSNHTSPTCLPDQIIAEFTLETRRNGSSAVPCISCPDIWLLCQPRPPGLPRCPSLVLIDLLSTFPGIVCLSEQVASFIFMYKLLIWECYPTLENYNNIPEWLRPTPTQLRIPHPAWMDRVPWPGMRSYLISHQETIKFDEFSTFYSGGLTISWPYPAGDILISCPSESCCNKIRINPVFEHHVMNLEVWGLKDSFLDHFPIFKDVQNL